VVNKMTVYARIEAGSVAELLRTEANIASLFHPALRWVEALEPAVAVGWIEGPNGLAAPPPRAPAPEPPATTTLEQLQARIAELAEQVAALTRR
jgi:hypothetical protein